MLCDRWPRPSINGPLNGPLDGPEHICAMHGAPGVGATPAGGVWADGVWGSRPEQSMYRVRIRCIRALQRSARPLPWDTAYGQELSSRGPDRPLVVVLLLQTWSALPLLGLQQHAVSHPSPWSRGLVFTRLLLIFPCAFRLALISSWPFPKVPPRPLVLRRGTWTRGLHVLSALEVER